MRPAASVAGPEEVERGPGPFGVHVVDGDRGDAAPVVDARVEERAPGRRTGSGGAWTWTSGGRTSRATAMVHAQLLGRAGRVVVHGRPRFGEEVLDDHLLDVAVGAVGVGDGRQGPHPLGARLADPDEHAGGEGDGQLAGGLEGGQPALGGLVGRSAVAGQVGVEGLEHHPLAGRDGPQPGQVVGSEGAGVGVGEQARLVADQRAHGHQVVDGRGVAVVVEPGARRRVALLGGLAQGEERLVAAGGGPGAGDGQHLVGGQVRGRPGGPAAWRRCSSRTGRGTAWVRGMKTLGE